MRHFTTVRVRKPIDAAHSALMGHKRRKLIAPLPDVLRIYLPPVPAWDGWNCGVERCWQVHDEDVIALTGALPEHGAVYVCEHQVELD